MNAILKMIFIALAVLCKILKLFEKTSHELLHWHLSNVGSPLT